MAVNYDILLDKVRNLGMEYKAANTFVKFLGSITFLMG